MKLLPLFIGLLLAASALDLGRAFLTHSGVGLFEWAVGVSLFVALTAGAARFARRSFRVS